MYGLFGFNLKQVIAAVIISGTVASVLCAAIAAHAAGADAGISVNRVSKGDRLPSNPAVNPAKANSETSPLPAKIPVGCEPTFSPVANPESQRAARSCLT